MLYFADDEKQKLSHKKITIPEKGVSLLLTAKKMPIKILNNNQIRRLYCRL